MTGADLITYVVENGSIPDGRFSDAEILRYADSEMMVVMKDIMSCRQDYGLVSVSVSGTTFQAGWPVPSGAQAGKIRDLQFVQGDARYRVPRTSIDRLPDGGKGYYFFGDTIKVHGYDLSNVTADVSYYQRHDPLSTTGSLTIPNEWQYVLAQRTLIKALDSIGDNEGYGRAMNKLKDLSAAAIAMSSDRDEAAIEAPSLNTSNPFVRRSVRYY